MIKKFVDAWESRKAEIRSVFEAAHPDDYKAVVKAVVGILPPDSEWSDGPSTERIHQIDDGDYQGTLVFVIAASGYQPSEYWYVKVGYGSCSGCDTLESIRGYEDGKPTQEQVDEYMTLALHVIQGLKKMGEDEAS